MYEMDIKEENLWIGQAWGGGKWGNINWVWVKLSGAFDWLRYCQFLSTHSAPYSSLYGEVYGLSVIELQEVFATKSSFIETRFL